MSSLKLPSIIIFDMDGTTVRHVNPRLLHMLEVLDDILHFLSRLFRALYFRRKVKTADLLAHGPKKAPRLLTHRILHRFRRKSVEQIVEPCPGIIEVLDFLRSKGVKLALVSNGLGKGYGYDILEKFDLDQYFKVTIFREDIHRSKPNPDPLLKALSQPDLSAQKEDVIWHIGDRAKDVRAALAAQDHLPCPILPLSYGLHATIELLKNGVSTDHILMTYEDLLEKLEVLFLASAR